ncbi:MAG TPA: histidine kinase dimerization/phospho-acceptor domain-containing protein [Kofleriaceae bacterium]|nr:histidine kinase dimerization/phospho-acceptor domain-containing protein [Kofleriaceae bacterium]
MLTDREVLDSLSTGVLVAGSDEVTRHANPAACRMLGRAAAACIDQPVPLLLGMSASLRDHGLDEIDAERRLALELPVGPAGATLRNVGGCGFVCLFRPNDEGRGADRRLQDAERESAITAMLAAFAHEVRNPLAAITAAADMLRADLPPGPADAHLAIIDRQIRRLAALAYTPFALGLPTTTQRVQCTVTHLVTDALAIVAADAASRKVELRIELDPELPRVTVGERELVDALAALLENAIAASPVGAVVLLAARPLADDDAPLRPRVLIEISDRGAGMAPAEIAEALRAFHPTRLASNATGLALAHRHILDSGGRLAISGGAGRGLRVRVELAAEAPR